ncbi:MAG TPA: 3-deoxy-8-phosphooctulonate synthase [Candidatus Omnitrophota bacterium]|nr:3-deoxy-8-phosphooctulonate synthase [Candidatus Omnitrophota bacterium]
MVKKIKVGDVVFGGQKPFVLIAGPCVIEDERTVMTIAENLKDITDRLKVPFVFKASYDKANRTSLRSFRGPGLKKGLKILNKVKTQMCVPVLSDIHTPEDAKEAAEVLDILQIPAFLCRQTDLLVAAAKTRKAVNIKKGQFLAPWDMGQAVAKVAESGNNNILLTERGTTFGYNTLVTDFRSLAQMRELGYPVIMDATHSVQQPGGLGKVSGGKSEFIPLMARCGVAAGCDGVFMEVHTDPKRALSDGPNMIAVDRLEDLLVDLITIDAVVKRKR